MLDILQQYLNECASPEDATCLGAAQDVFDKMGLEVQDAGFTQILVLADDTDPGETLLAIYHLTKELQDGLLHQHGVRVNNDTPIGVQTDILNALLQIPELEDQHEVIAIAQQPLNAIEILAELVEKVTQHSAVAVLQHLDFVSQMLIDQVIHLGDQPEIKEDDEMERMNRTVRVEKFTRFMDFVQQTKSAVQLMIRQGVDAGFPFAMYVNLIGRDFEAMPPDEAALNLIGMAFLSEDGFGNPQALIADRIDNLIADTEKLTKVSMTVREMLLRFAHHDQS
jgi:hypothetical protein